MTDRAKERIIIILCILAIGALSLCVFRNANAQAPIFYKVDSSENVQSRSVISIGSAMAVPINLVVMSGDGAKFARIGVPLEIMLSPYKDSTLYQSFELDSVTAVKGDTLVISKRKLTNSQQLQWNNGTLVRAVNDNGVIIRQLQRAIAGLGVQLPDTTAHTGQALFVLHGGLGWQAVGAGSGVTSFNTRTGVVVPMNGDYAFSQITGVAGVTQGGTGLNAITSNKILYGSSTNVIGQLGIGTGLGISSGTLNVTLSPFTTTNLTEGSNLYYTDVRAQNAISASAPLTYSGGVIGINASSSVANGYVTASQVNTWDGKQDALTLPLPIAQGGTGQATRPAALKALLPDTTGQTSNVLGVQVGGGIGWVAGGGGGGSGTVTSAGLSMPAEFSVSGSPITTSGIFTVTRTTQTANKVLAGPTTGSPAVPTYRSIVTGDLPTGIPNANLANSALTVTAGSGMSGGGSVSLGGSVTLTNAGVTSVIAGTGIGVSGATGAVTLTNSGVTSLTGTANQVNVSASTGGVTLSTPQDIATGSSPIFTGATLTGTTNQLVLGTTNTTTLSATAPAASSIYTIPDVGTAANFVMTQGAQTLAGQKTFSTTIVGSITGNSGTVTNGVYTIGTNTLTGAQNLEKDNIKTTYTTAATLKNGTASDAVNTAQQSPSLLFDAHGWSTASTAADSELMVRITDVPVTAANATSKFNIDFGNASLGFTNQFSLTNAGVLTLGSPLPIASGGTGAATANDALNALLPSQGGNAGKVLTTDATNTSWTALSGVSVTSFNTRTGAVVPAAGDYTEVLGGTGQTSYATGDILYASGTNTLSKLTVGAATTVLHGGTTPSYSQIVNGDITNATINLTTKVTGTLPVGNGGIGVATLASNGVLYGNGTGAVQALAVNSTGTNKFLTQSSSAAPAWATLVSGDIPNNAANTTGSAAKWTTARNLAGNSVDGSANVAFSNAFVVQGTADAGLSGAQFLGALGTGIVKNTTTTGVLSIAVAGDFPTLNQNTTGSAATLTTPRAIYGNNFDGSAALAQIIASTYGGTGNGFTKFSGATTAEKTYTLPDASTTILTTNAAVTVAQGGTGLATLTANNVILGNGTSNVQFVAPGTSGNTLQSNGTTWVSAAGGSGTVTSVATGSGLTGGTITTIGTLSLDLTSANVFTAAQTVNKAGIATTYTNGLVLQNTTASTSGVTVQQSPSLVWDARSWSTTSVAADSQSTVRMTLVPTSGVNPLTSHLILDVGTTNRGFAKALDWQLSNNTAQTGALIITANEMQIGSAANAGQITDLWLGYGKTGGGGYNATYHAGNGNGSNNPGANFFAQAGIGTGTQLGGEFDWISSFVGSTGSTLNTTRTLMTLVPTGTSGTTAKATLTLGVASSADASIVLKNLTNANTYTIAEVAPSASRTLTIQDPAGAADILMATTNLSTAGHLAVTTATRGKLEDNANQGITQILTFANNGAAGRAIQISDASANDGDPLSLYAGNANGTDANGGQIVWNTGEGTGAGNGGQLTLQASFPGTTGTTLRARHTLMQVVPTGTLTSTALATLSLGETGGGTVGGALAFYRAADANTVTIKTATTASSETYTIQDAGAAADFLMSTTNLSTANQTVMTTSTRGNLKSAAANVLTGTPSNPTGTASSTALMMGLGATATFTPVTTGAVTFVISCNINSGATGSPVIQLRYGTGAAPVNGAASTGTAVGFAAKETGLANGSIPATLVGAVTGLTASTAYWFDVSLKSDGTSVASITDVYVQAVEIK